MFVSVFACSWLMLLFVCVFNSCFCGGGGGGGGLLCLIFCCFVGGFCFLFLQWRF